MFLMIRRTRWKPWHSFTVFLATLIGRKVTSVMIFSWISTGHVDCIDDKGRRLKEVRKFAKMLDLLAALKIFLDEISKNG